jgi:hypothetical protein
MTRVSAAMRQGETCSDIAVYMPIEDARMQNELPHALRKPSALYHWEMHYARFPEGLKGYRPLWISTPFLISTQYQDGQLTCGSRAFKSIYVDVEWLDRDALSELLRLAKQGAPICLKRRPRETGRVKSEAYDADYRALTLLRNVSADLGAVMSGPRLVRGLDIPDFWCRKNGDEHTFFFAHPRVRGLRYPLAYGQSHHEQAMRRDVEISIPGRRVAVTLNFAPYQSLLLRVTTQGAVEFLDAAFVPATPVY